MSGRAALAAAALVLAAWGATCGEAAGITLFTAQPGENDIEVQATVLARVRAGESYYAVVVDELHRRGYPTSSPFNFRLPALVWFLALMPRPGAAVLVLIGLGILTALCWGAYLVRERRSRRWWLALPLAATMLPVWTNPNAVHLNDLWTGQLIALSLAARVCGRLPLALVSAALATLVRELAWPYVLAMGTVAWLLGHRRETWAWLAVMGVGLAVFALQVAATRGLGPPDALQSGWVAVGGWCFALRTARMNPVLMLLPTWLHAVLVSACLAGVWLWRSTAGRRVAVILTLYVVCFLVVGRPDNFYWGLLIAPILPLGAVGWAPMSRSGAGAAAGIGARRRLS